MAEGKDLMDILAVSGDLEGLLRARGGVGSGIGELTRSMGDELPVNLRDRLLALAKVRNKLVHQSREIPELHAERFVKEAHDCCEHLRALQPEGAFSEPLDNALWLTRQLRERESASVVVPEAVQAEAGRRGKKRRGQFQVEQLDVKMQDFTPVMIGLGAVALLALVFLAAWHL